MNCNACFVCLCQAFFFFPFAMINVEFATWDKRGRVHSCVPTTIRYDKGAL